MRMLRTQVGYVLYTITSAHATLCKTLPIFIINGQTTKLLQRKDIIQS